MRIPMLLLSGALFLGACAPSMPVPDWKLGGVPYEKKESMRLAKEELDQAQYLAQQGDQALKDNEKFIDQAKAEREIAEAEKSAAKVQKDNADSGGKAQEIALAQKRTTLSDLQYSAADLRLQHAEAAAEYAKKEKDFAEYRLTAAQDNYEMVKLRILEENNKLSDAGIKDPGKVKTKAQKSAEKYKVKQADFDSLRKSRDELKTKYDAAQSKYDAAKLGAPEATKPPEAPTTPASNPTNPPLKTP